MIQPKLEISPDFLSTCVYVDELQSLVNYQAHAQNSGFAFLDAHKTHEGKAQTAETPSKWQK